MHQNKFYSDQILVATIVRCKEFENGISLKNDKVGTKLVVVRRVKGMRTLYATCLKDKAYYDTCRGTDDHFVSSVEKLEDRMIDIMGKEYWEKKYGKKDHFNRETVREIEKLVGYNNNIKTSGFFL